MKASHLLFLIVLFKCLFVVRFKMCVLVMTVAGLLSALWTEQLIFSLFLHTEVLCRFLLYKGVSVCSVGEITVRTHTASRVVNQHSRFHTSAGIHGQPHHHHQSHSSPTSSINIQPAPSASLATSSLVNHSLTRSLTAADGTDHLPPGQPVTIYPLLQIKQPYLPASKRTDYCKILQIELL